MPLNNCIALTYGIILFVHGSPGDLAFSDLVNKNPGLIALIHFTDIMNT